MSIIDTESDDYLAGRIAALDELEADYNASLKKMQEKYDEVLMQCATCSIWQSGYNVGYKDADRHNNPGNYDKDGNFITRG